MVNSFRVMFDEVRPNRIERWHAAPLAGEELDCSLGGLEFLGLLPRMDLFCRFLCLVICQKNNINKYLEKRPCTITNGLYILRLLKSPKTCHLGCCSQQIASYGFVTSTWLKMDFCDESYEV